MGFPGIDLIVGRVIANPMVQDRLGLNTAQRLIASNPAAMRRVRPLMRRVREVREQYEVVRDQYEAVIDRIAEVPATALAHVAAARFAPGLARPF